MSSSSTSVGGYSGSMLTFQYRPMSAAPLHAEEHATEQKAIEHEVQLTEAELKERLAAERAKGFAEAELLMKQKLEQHAQEMQAKLSNAITSFGQKQKTYFECVESEIVQLALAIAGKILHREAQVDPLLLTAIVHVALEQLKEGSAATIRVRPEEAARWRDYSGLQSSNIVVNVIEDPELERGDCILDTELGSVNFSLDAQLKEVERGFFDVLAQKPKL